MATLIAAAADRAPRACVPSTARLLGPRPAPEASQSCHQPHEDAAPLKNQGVREGESGDLGIATRSSGQKVAAIALQESTQAKVALCVTAPSLKRAVW